MALQTENVKIDGNIISMLKSSPLEFLPSTADASKSSLVVLNRPGISESILMCGGKDLDACVNNLNNWLISDMVKIGEGLRGHLADERNYEKTAHIMSNMLKAGLTYVFSGASLIGSLSMHRAYLDLRSALPKHIKKRQSGNKMRSRII